MNLFYKKAVGVMMSSRKYYAIVLTILFAAYISLLIYSIKSYIDKIESLKQDSIQDLANKIYITTNAYENLAKLLFDDHIDDTEIERIMFLADRVKSKKEKDELREKLFLMNEKMYTLLKRYNFRQLHYHLSNTESFLRMHRPKKYGDTLGTARMTVLKANREMVFQKGFEEGRIFNGYRYVFPLTYQGKHSGTMEISFSIAMLINNLEKLFANDYHFVISKDIVDKKVFKEERVINYKVCEISDQFYIDKNAVSTNIYNVFSDSEFNSILKNHCKNSMEEFIPFCHTVRFNENLKLVTGMPIKNNEGGNFGFILQLSDDTERFINFRTALILSLTGLSIVFILLLTISMIIKRHSRKSIELSRLQAANAMSITASHEINQPLEIILMNSELLEMTNSLDEKGVKKIRNIGESVRRIKDILNRMLNINHIELEKYTDNEDMVNLNKSLEDMDKNE